MLAQFVGKKAKFGVTKNVFFSLIYFYTKWLFSGHFALGSKWLWSLQNDKRYILGPIESPTGVRKGPWRAKNAPKTLLGPFWPIFPIFLAQAGNSSESFWVKIGPNGRSRILGPFLALLGHFLTPLGLSVGPNVYILSIWRYQNHLEPNEKWSEA